MKTNWLEENASVEQIAGVLKASPSCRNNFFIDIVSQKEKVFTNNPTLFDEDKDFFSRMYEVSELPNCILSGHTYRNIFNFIKNNNIRKEDLEPFYEGIGSTTPIWVVESFKGPLMKIVKKGPYAIIFFNESPTE